MSFESAATERRQRLEREPLAAVGQRSGLVTGTWKSVVEVWRQRELLGRLVRREVKARYKDSSLGIVWSLFRPIAQLLVYYFAIGKILGAARATPDFAIFVFIGLTMWALFSEIVSASTTSILANAGLIKKVYIPREVFPLAAVGGALVNFGIQLLVLAAGIVVLASDYPSFPNLLLAPLAAGVVIVFSTAVGIILAALNVYLRDIQHLVEIALIFLFWASPIVYSFTFVHNELGGSIWEQVYLANPITISIIAFQKALWAAGSTATGDFTQVFPDDIVARLLVSLLASLILLWVSQRVFARLQGNFAQEL